MKEQKFLITSNKKDIAMEEVNSIISEGWVIVSVFPRSVSTTSSAFSVTEHGGFAILFEREKY
jgi:hypothetical protein